MLSASVRRKCETYEPCSSVLEIRNNHISFYNSELVGMAFIFIYMYIWCFWSVWPVTLVFRVSESCL